MPLNDFIKRILPASFYPLVRDLPYYFDRGPLGRIGATDPPIPRLHNQFDGERGYDIFEQNGQEAFGFYREVMGIQPDWKVLDIGSGIGRKTRPLLKFIADPGLYVGVDIDGRGIKWCSDHLSPVNNRFVFFKLNIYNSFYNPSGGVKAEQLVLPFADNGFDMTVLWSVFTHMYVDGIARYLAEIARVLKPGGLIAASYLILNDEARSRVHSGQSTLRVTHPLPDGLSWTNNPNVPEDAIAVDEQWLRKAHADAGLVMREPVLFGSWSGTPASRGQGSLNYQDIVIAEKPR